MNKNKLTAILFCVIGIIAVVVGIIMLSNSKKFVKATGIVTAVRREDRSDSDSTEIVYDVGFTYTVDGKIYSAELEFNSNKYKVGDEISFLYNPKNPKTVQTPGSSGFYIYFIAIGAVFAIVGAFLFIKKS